MLFFDIRGSLNARAYRVPLDGPLNGEVRILPLVLSPNAYASQVSISPDGGWIAYTSNESGRDEIYVRPFPDIQSARWMVSTSGGQEPIWARDGRQLYYRSGDAIVAIDVITQPAFIASAPQILFQGAYVGANYLPSYDVSPDGERFLLMKDLQ